MLRLYDFNGNIDSLINGANAASSAGATIFTDLGTDHYTNVRNVTKPSSTANPAMPAIEFTLNSAAFADLLAATTASDNRFVVGAGLTDNFTTNNYLWGGDANPVSAATLNISYTAMAPVPEPASMAMMAAGLAGLGWRVRRRRGRA